MSNLHTDIGAIMTIEKVTFNGEGVSWTDKPIDYYIHRINRKRLFDFIERRANVCADVTVVVFVHILIQ